MSNIPAQTPLLARDDLEHVPDPPHGQLFALFERGHLDKAVAVKIKPDIARLLCRRLENVKKPGSHTSTSSG